MIGPIGLPRNPTKNDVRGYPETLLVSGTSEIDNRTLWFSPSTLQRSPDLNGMTIR
jgi:hypothetical protein